MGTFKNYIAIGCFPANLREIPIGYKRILLVPNLINAIYLRIN